MSPERLNQRLAMWLRLKELRSMQSRKYLLHGAGSDLIANEIHRLESELRRKEWEL